jgi:hypothetical protein
MRKLSLAAAMALALSLGACANVVNSVHQFSTNYQTVVADINADIAATAPDVAVACANLQTAAMLIQPFLPSSTNAQAAFSAANAGITAYCQTVPTNIPQVLAQVKSAITAAQAAYNSIKSGSSTTTTSGSPS